jgi:hypothetical protein
LGDEKQDGTDDEDGFGSHAADEPTAVWDAKSLREAGLGDLINKPDSEPPPPATPATKGEKQGPSIVVDQVAAGAKAQQVTSGSGGSELGWLSTLALAVGLGGAVYALIRLLK